MDPKTFFNCYVSKINEIMEEGFVRGRNDPDELDRSAYTFCFNVAMYEIAKSSNLSISVECKTGKAYTDIAIYSEDETTKLIEIEHENIPSSNRNIEYENRMEKAVCGLMESGDPAKFCIVITFHYKGYSRKKAISDFVRFSRAFPDGRSRLYMILSKEEYENIDDFDLIDSEGTVILNGIQA
ncbi:MAG: hypothetical protein ABII22_04510 [Candidatus Micrarchaeota archaeon]